MPYEKLEDLPDTVRENLPRHAQAIFKEAFNHAFEEYQEPSKRRDPHEDPESIAFAVAWSAVKDKYEKAGEKWVPKAA